MTETPEAAHFQWRARASGSTAPTAPRRPGLLRLGPSRRHRAAFAFDTDHPEIFASEDNGADPVEIVLAPSPGA